MFNICKALHFTIWLTLLINSNDKLSMQLKSVVAVYNQFFEMKAFKNIDKEIVMDGYNEVVS